MKTHDLSCDSRDLYVIVCLSAERCLSCSSCSVILLFASGEELAVAVVDFQSTRPVDRIGQIMSLALVFQRELWLVRAVHGMAG